MHTHLRAWRKFRGLSQEAVGHTLNVRHTTIGRWESGSVPLTTDDLANLAKVYDATVGQLQADPQLAGMVTRLERAQRIFLAMDAEGIEQWLALGEKASGTR